MNTWIINPFSITLFVSAFLAGVIAHFLWARRESPGALPLAIFMAIASGWSLAYGIELGASSFESKMFWAKVGGIGISFLPSLALTMILQYHKDDTKLSKHALFFLYTFPVAATLMHLTNEQHHWVVKNIRMIPAGPIYLLKGEFNWFFWFYAGYTYLLLAYGAWLLLQDFRQGNEAQRKRTRLMLTGMFLVGAINVFSLFDPIPTALPDIDWTPFSFILLGAFAAWGLFRMEFFIIPSLSAKTFEPLVTPHISLLEEDYRRARSLATLSLLLLLPALTLGALATFTEPQYAPVAFFIAGSLLVTYFFSRTSLYKVGNWVLLAGAILSPILAALLLPNHSPEQVFRILLWVLPALLLGGWLISPLGMWGLFLGTVGTLWLTTEQILGISWKELSPLYVLVLAFSALSTFASWSRNREFREIADITLKLARNEKYLNHIINSLDAPFYVINIADYSIELANQAAAQFGVTGGQTCYALTHRRATPCDGMEHPCPLMHVKDTRQPYVVEHIHYKPDGSTYYAEVHGYPILDETGNVVQMIEYSLDITERKLAEIEIRKLTRSVEQSASSVVITDAEGVIEYVNPAFERISGYSAEEAIGQTPRILKSGKMPPQFYEELWATLLRGEVWRGEIINRRKNGTLYWEFTTITPVENEQGQITHFVSVKEDITERKRLENALAEERRKTDSLLRNILPEKVAEELKRQGHVTPVLIEEATVLFADFSNFTQAAERLTPQELVTTIDTYFTAFDNIIERHGLEKLKTIGDNYMCAGGIPVERPSHAVDVVCAALDMLAFIRQENVKRRKQGKPAWEMRIGISSGPVIAGVVGRKKYAYDIWGDTVVMAARMEAAGAIGKINISRSTYELIREQFDCEYRGKVAAKHKGEVEMFFVRAPKATPYCQVQARSQQG